jgi:hypothetical protein
MVAPIESASAGRMPRAVSAASRHAADRGLPTTISPARVTGGNDRFNRKVNAIKKGSARQKDREPFHAFGKSTTSARQFMTSIVITLNDNPDSP